MIKEKIQKKGISPVIATVLLVAMVIVIGLIIFLWFSSMTKEAITKFGGTNIELVCKDVEFSAEYTNGFLGISNYGNVPIYSMSLKIFDEDTASYSTKNLKEELPNDWPETGLKQGGIFSSAIDFSGAEEVTVIPILIGSSKSGKKTFICDEQYGHEII